MRRTNKKKTQRKSGRTYVSRTLWSSGVLSRNSRISIRLWVYLREENNPFQSLQAHYSNIKPDPQTSYSGKNKASLLTGRKFEQNQAHTEGPPVLLLMGNKREKWSCVTVSFPFQRPVLAEHSAFSPNNNTATITVMVA